MLANNKCMIVAKQPVTNEQYYLIISEQEINTGDKVVDGWSGPDISPPRALGNAVISTCVVRVVVGPVDCKLERK